MGDPPLEESDLVDRARRGDASAYDLLVQRYQELAFRAAYQITREAAEAEDAAQEAFVKAYYALAGFRPGAPFRPWLLRIVANEARNRRVATQRRARLALRAGEELPRADTAPSPEAAALVAEQRAALLAAVEQLREEERLTIAYRYFLDLSEPELAEILGCARGTVKSRLSRGLARLRALLPRPSSDQPKAQQRNASDAEGRRG
jgi:RNA polymerase sigma-70 factor (ECF subfamily)